MKSAPARGPGPPPVSAPSTRRLREVQTRRAERIVLPTDHTVAVVIHDADGRVIGRGSMQDLSLRGVGVLMPNRLGRRIALHDRLTVSVELAPGTPPLRLAARTSHCAPALAPGAEEFGPLVVLLGLEFEAFEQGGGQDSQRLRDWLMARLERTPWSYPAR